MSTPVSESYDELVHYTSATGLTGIINSGRLWATHAAFLNDSVEMTHFFDIRLKELAEAEVRIYAEELGKDPSILRKMAQDGGVDKIAPEEAERLASILRTATLSHNQPYILSLTAPRTERIRSSGLLSQWRGYGPDGGYAVVFDTANFETLLYGEAKSYKYQYVQWADVFYYGEDGESQPAAEDVVRIEKIVREGIASLIRGGLASDVDGFYDAVSGASCRYKHWGFHEEREVRVIASLFDNASTLNPEFAACAGVEKPIKQFVRGGIPVPYIELFSSTEGKNRMLPIKRVIIGPHRDTELRRRAVEKMLWTKGYKCEVVCSNIPYIGRWLA